jgi:hypothetical protein
MKREARRLVLKHRRDVERRAALLLERETVSMAEAKATVGDLSDGGVNHTAGTRRVALGPATGQAS